MNYIFLLTEEAKNIGDGFVLLVVMFIVFWILVIGVGLYFAFRASDAKTAEERKKFTILEFLVSPKKNLFLLTKRLRRADEKEIFNKQSNPQEVGNVPTNPVSTTVTQANQEYQNQHNSINENNITNTNDDVSNLSIDNIIVNSLPNDKHE